MKTAPARESVPQAENGSLASDGSDANPPASAVPSTWIALLERNAREEPDAVALIDGERTRTHAELLARVRRLTNGFASLGIAPGQIVAIWLPNCIEWVESAAALAALGATALGVNTKLRSYDVQGLLDRADCNVLVTSPGFKGIDFLDMLNEVHAADPDAVRLVVEVSDPAAPSDTRPEAEADSTGSGSTPFSTVSYESLFFTEPHALQPSDSRSLASAFTSSGSTGVPKIIMHSQAGLLGHSAAVGERFGYADESTVVLASLPLCGVFGLNTLMAAMTAKRPTVLQAVFDPESTIGLIRSHRVTRTNMSDAMVTMTLDALARPEDFESVREIGFGNFTAADARQIIELGRRLGVRLFQTYGSSEVQALMCYPAESADEARLALGGGVPVSARTDVRVVPVAADDEEPGNAPQDPSGGPLQGEIEVRGPFVSPGRITENGYEPTPVDEEGWFSTGDLGYMYSERDVVYLSRMGDVLRLGGFLVAPREVEDFLITVDGITEAQFVAAQTERGLVPVAFVITEDEDAGFDEESALEKCRSTLARFKVPRRVIPLDSFPTVRGANGDKIQRSRLREMAETVLSEPSARS